MEDLHTLIHPRRPRIAVGIATTGRYEILTETLIEIGRQNRFPDRIVLAPVSPEDCPELSASPVKFEIVYGPKGLPAQRNTIISAATDIDIVVFFDDDFFPEPSYLAEIERVMVNNPAIAIVTGSVLADDILGPGFPPSQARDILRSASPLPAETLITVYNGYGCNMAVRLDLVRAHGLSFDENLPLYAWLEDVDFSRRLAPYGSIVKSARARGVHLGTKKSRSPGLRLGYSQVANPIYLMRSGTMSWDRALLQMSRNISANIRKARNPEAWVDRTGRLKGNILAICDLFRGKLHPSNIRQLP